MRKCFVTQYCVLSSQITSVGYVGNVICLKFVQESFKVLFEKELVKNMMYLMWELNPRLSVHETDTLPSELMRFYICQAGFEPTTFRTTVWHSTNWAIGRTDRIWVQEYNLIEQDKIFKIVEQRKYDLHMHKPKLKEQVYVHKCVSDWKNKLNRLHGEC